jgi:benzylsuccinate CoA-transferase BbsF subunit
MPVLSDTKEAVMTSKALAGVKVAALVQGITGPMTAHILGAYGAEVIRIESRTRIEWHRQAGPFIGNEANPDRSGAYLFMNHSVLDFTLNLKSSRAMEVWTKIVKWADVIVENFAGGVMQKNGMGYDDLKKINPGIILLSAAIFGQTGPFAQVPGYGGTLTAISGLPHITGFADQNPQFPCFAITDFIAPRTNVLMIMAALEHRRKTGEGQFIDAAQLESIIPLLNPVLLGYQTNGNEGQRIGNHSSYAAPHSVYRCRDEGSYCVITVFSETEWQNFGKVIGNPDWYREERFATCRSRLDNVDELDKLVETWTRQHTPQEVQDLMQAAGIAASAVANGASLDADPQLAHRGYYWRINHEEFGNFTYSGMPAKFSETPYELKPAPMLGEHTEMICTQFLGMDDEEFVSLMVDGVFE